MSFESPDFDCCERLRKAVIGLERAVAGGARLPSEGLNGSDGVRFHAGDSEALALLKEENQILKKKQAEAALRLDKLIDNLSDRMELDS